VALRYIPTRPDHTPTWAREDDHDDENDEEWEGRTSQGSGSASRGRSRSKNYLKPHPLALGSYVTFRRHPETGRISHYAE
jgi:hypothetical protein